MKINRYIITAGLFVVGFALATQGNFISVVFIVLGTVRGLARH